MEVDVTASETVEPGYIWTSVTPLSSILLRRVTFSPTNILLVGELHKHFERRTLEHKLLQTRTFGLPAQKNAQKSTHSLALRLSLVCFLRAEGGGTWRQTEEMTGRVVVGKNDTRGKRWRTGAEVFMLTVPITHRSVHARVCGRFPAPDDCDVVGKCRNECG